MFYELVPPPFFFQMIILFMYLYTSDDVMLDFICMVPVDLLGARRKRQNTKWKIIGHIGIQTHSM